MHSEPNIFIRILILVFFVFLLEIWAFRSMKRTWDSKTWWKHFTKVWWLVTLVVWTGFISSMLNYKSWSVSITGVVSTFTMAFFLNLVPKLFLAVLQIADDIRYLSQLGVRRITKSDNPIPRSTFLNYIGQTTAFLSLSGLFYGAVWGKYAYRVENVSVTLNRLPKAFHGLRILQFSDAHLGSFIGQPQPVLDALKKINSLKPDLILFTGDLVNTIADEAELWIDAFRDLEAPLGKFSILGNHDYADYGDFTDDEKDASLNRLKEIHEEMGFKLMLNEHTHLEHEGERIVLAGVENWGKDFRKSGDLEQALKGSGSEELCTILMSHDPTHFEEEVMGGKAPVDFTLSGHTHGMQMGIEIASLGIKFSPARMRYKRWGGLYDEDGQKLHVNRGFGVLGFHGRVGMPPELTVLELRQERQES